MMPAQDAPKDGAQLYLRTSPNQNAGKCRLLHDLAHREIGRPKKGRVQVAESLEPVAEKLTMSKCQKLTA
jgi:hypothetical protein